MATDALPENVKLIADTIPEDMRQIVDRTVAQGLSAVVMARQIDGSLKELHAHGLECERTPKTKDMRLEQILAQHLNGATAAAHRFAMRYDEVFLIDNTQRICAGTKPDSKSAHR